MEAKLVENERLGEVAKSEKDLKVAQATYTRDTELAIIQAEAAAHQQRYELQLQVEQKRKEQEIEKKRADTLSTTTVEAEVAIKTAEGKAGALKVEAEIAIETARGNATSLRIEAEGKAAALKAEAEGKAAAIEIEAKAQATAKRFEAEAAFFAAEHEARGIAALREAEATGLRKLFEGAGNDIDSLNRYMMVRDGTLQQLASEQAKGLQGLRPQVSIWQTGGAGESPGFLTKTMTEAFQSAMPLFDGIEKHTGMQFLSKIRRDSDEKKEK